MAVKKLRRARANKASQRTTNKFRHFLLLTKIYFKYRIEILNDSTTYVSALVFTWCVILIFLLVGAGIAAFFMGGFGHSGLWVWLSIFGILLLALGLDMYFFQSSNKKHNSKVVFRQVYEAAQKEDSKLNQLLTEQSKLKYEAAKATQEWAVKIKRIEQDVNLRKKEIKTEMQIQIKPLLDSKQAMNL